MWACWMVLSGGGWFAVPGPALQEASSQAPHCAAAPREGRGRVSEEGRPGTAHLDSTPTQPTLYDYNDTDYDDDDDE